MTSSCFLPWPPPSAKRYVLRIFISLKYVTASVVDLQRGKVTASASSMEKPLRDGLQCRRACTAKAASAVGEVLAMRLRLVDDLSRLPIHADVSKEVRKKGTCSSSKVWAIINALRDRDVSLVLEDEHGPRPRGEEVCNTQN